MKIKYLSIFPIVAALVLSGFSLANAQSDVFTQNLYYGLQNNSQVTQLQEFLTSQGLYSGPVTGNYYFLTLAAVKAFQMQQGITPAAGYFGPITMVAANKIADSEVGASNNQAISETGTSTPSTVPASSTAQLQLTTLLQEVALLQQQLQAQQSSTQVLQQIANNTQSNTTVAPSQGQSQGSTPAPTASITVNGSANSINIPYNTATTISWSSTNASSCNVSPAGWSGISSNQSTGNLTTSQTYTLSCSDTGGSTSASITINVASAPTLASIQLSGTNAGSNQLYTGIEDTNLSVKLFDKNGNPITTASATISTDDPNPSGIGFGNYANNEFETNSTNGSTFTITDPAFHNGYIFGYKPQTDGQHTITVSALGSTQSVIVNSVQQPPSLSQLFTISQNNAVGSQSVVGGTKNTKIGSYTFNAPRTEGANINVVTIEITPGTYTSAFQNLKMIINGVQFGSTQPVANGNTSYSFSGSAFNVPAGQTVNVDVYADILLNVSGTYSPATAVIGYEGTGNVGDGLSFCASGYSCNYNSIGQGQVINGQSVTIAPSSSQ